MEKVTAQNGRHPSAHWWWLNIPHFTSKNFEILRLMIIVLILALHSIPLPGCFQLVGLETEVARGTVTGCLCSLTCSSMPKQCLICDANISLA